MRVTAQFHVHNRSLSLQGPSKHHLFPLYLHLPQFPHLMPAPSFLYPSYDPLTQLELLSIPETGQDYSLRVLLSLPVTLFGVGSSAGLSQALWLSLEGQLYRARMFRAGA